MKENKTPIIHHPHDTFFKKMLRTPEVAIDLLKARLETHVLDALDLSTFKLENSSFIDERLKATHSDLVFSLKSKTKEERCYVYFLIEHQTSYEPNIMLRLWEYNTKLMRQHITQGGKGLPVIFNLIFYTGKKAYRGSKTLLGAFHQPELLLASLQRNTLIELNKEEDSSLAKDGKAALLQLLLKHEKDRDFCKLLDNEKMQVGALINKTPHALTVFLYMLDREKHEPEELLRKLNNLTPHKQDEIMTGLQRLRNQDIKFGEERGMKLGKHEGMKLGKQEGIKLGEQKGAKQEKIQIAKQMLKEGEELGKITKYTGLRTQELAKLKKAL